MSVSLFFFGGRRIRVPKEFRTDVLNLCLLYGESPVRMEAEADGAISFTLPVSSARALVREARARGMELEVRGAFGIPSLLCRLLRRPGLFAGAVLGLLLLLLSGRFVWAVEVKGNETVTDAEVKEILSACGFGVGSYLPGLEIPALENHVLVFTDRLSWLSINIDGTVASVQVLERTVGTPAEESARRPANLIAARDGQIEYTEIFRGECEVKAGQAVREGELLVSGVYEGTNTGNRFTRAAGRVLARTEHTFEVEIPYAWEEKQEDTPVLCALTLKFFNFSLNFFENSGNMGESCDIIENEKVLPMGGRHVLPISLAVKTAVPYTLESRTRTEEEALTLAHEALGRELAALSANAVLLSKEIRTEVGETGVRLLCTVSAVEDIARVQEFEIEE